MPAFALERRGILAQSQGAPAPTRLSSAVLPLNGSLTVQSVNVTVPANCKGALVLLPQFGIATDDIASVLIAGLALTRVGDQAGAYSTGASRCYAYFLGSVIPAGNWLMYVIKNGVGHGIQPEVHFFTAAGDTAIDAIASSLSGDTTATAIAPQAISLAADAREMFHEFATADVTTAHFTAAGGTTQDSIVSNADGTQGVARKLAVASGANSLGFNGSVGSKWTQLAASVKNAVGLVSPPALSYDEMIMRRQGVRAYYPFDDAAKTAFVNKIRPDTSGDISGTASSSFLGGSATNLTAHVSGPKGTDFAAQFGAFTSAVGVTTSGTLCDLGNTFGGEFWFKRDRANGVAGSAPPDGREWVLMRWDGSATGAGMGWVVLIEWSTGRVVLSHVGGSDVCHTSATVNDLNWHHLAFGKNGSSNVLILDGTSVAVSDTNTEVIPNGNRFTAAGDYSGRPYLGKLAKFAVYNRMPTQAEAAESIAF
jgi:hypothetical protein